jgi:hypothetical protein
MYGVCLDHPFDERIIRELSPFECHQRISHQQIRPPRTVEPGEFACRAAVPFGAKLSMT